MKIKNIAIILIGAIILFISGIAVATGINNISEDTTTSSNNSINSSHSHEHDEDGNHIGSESKIESADAETLSLSEFNIDNTNFFKNSITKQITEQNCTLSNGEESTCYSITIAGYPSNYEAGPFCPRTTNDTADTTGIWLDGENLYDLDGQFIKDLPEIYSDDEWVLYDENGNVRYTDTEDAFNGAAQPQVEEEYKYNCVEGRLEWLDGGEPISETYLIPKNPIKSDSTQSGTKVGLTLNGVVIDPAAPVDAILNNYTIAAFDDCGGHFNPVEGYHQHAIIDCFELENEIDGETAQIGYALDGFPIHAPIEDRSELDECGGHETEGIGYHYHANNPEDNEVLSCFKGYISNQYIQSTGGRPMGPR